MSTVCSTLRIQPRLLATLTHGHVFVMGSQGGAMCILWFAPGMVRYLVKHFWPHSHTMENNAWPVHVLYKPCVHVFGVSKEKVFAMEPPTRGTTQSAICVNT